MRVFISTTVYVVDSIISITCHLWQVLHSMPQHWHKTTPLHQITLVLLYFYFYYRKLLTGLLFNYRLLSHIFDVSILTFWHFDSTLNKFAKIVPLISGPRLCCPDDRRRRRCSLPQSCLPRPVLWLQEIRLCNKCIIYTLFPKCYKRGLKEIW